MDANTIFAIIFYLIIGLLVFRYRKKFDVQGKIIFLYRTKIGLKLMDKIANKFPNLLRFLGYTGILVGFLGMVTITYLLIKGTIDFIFVPSAPAQIAPVIPGFKIPGIPLTVPLVYGLLSLFIVIVIHEFSHGVIARVHNIRLKSSGVGLFAVIPLAFVEPDEKELNKKTKKQQLSVLAAGPFSNIILGLLVFLLMPFAPSPYQESIVTPDGVYFDGLIEGDPAKLAEVQENVPYTFFNNKSIKDQTDFTNLLDQLKPGEKIILGNEKVSHEIITKQNPNNTTKAYFGVIGGGINTHYQIKPGKKVSFYLLEGLNQFLFWLVLLSFGLGFANLLPLGPVDGGKMLLVSLLKICKKEKTAKNIWVKISLFILLIIAINIAYPLLRYFFNKVFL